MEAMNGMAAVLTGNTTRAGQADIQPFNTRQIIAVQSGGGDGGAINEQYNNNKPDSCTVGQPNEKMNAKKPGDYIINSGRSE